MANKVWDSVSFPGTKSNRPNVAAVPAYQKVDAAEFNELVQLLKDMRGTAQDVHVFDLKARFGAKADGLADDLAPFENAMAAASTYVNDAGNTYGHKAVVRMGPGTYMKSAPVFIPPSVTLMCDGRNDAVIVPLNYRGYDFILGYPADDLSHSHGPFVLGSFSVPGQYTYAHPGTRQPDNNFFDVSQVPFGRLPDTGSWTFSHHFKFDDVSTFASIWIIAGTLWPAMPNGTCLGLIFQTGSSFRIDFRLNGQGFSRNINVPSPPTIVVGSEIDFEVSWNGTQLRVFLNGQLWNDNAWTPTGGSGVADGSGFVQKPYETWSIGMGASNYFTEEIAAVQVAGSFSQFHLSDNVRHTANYTPAAPVADGHTLLLIDFTRFYKGLLIGTSLKFGPLNCYLHPCMQETWEAPQITLKNFFMYGGGGIYAPFASQLEMDRVTALGCTDGWRLTKNGYFSHIRNCDSVAGAGRSMLDMQGGSYCSITNCTMAGPICYSFNSANVFGGNNSATIHPNTYIGLYYTGGGILDWTGFSIDAEEASVVAYVAAAVIVDPESFTLRTSTLYGPTNKRTTNPIVRVMNTADFMQVMFDHCNFSYPPTAGVVIQNEIVTIPPVGTANWTHPIIVIDPSYYAPLNQFTDNPGNVIIVSEVRDFQRAQLGTAAPGSGTWRRGNIVINSTPSASGWYGWVCVTAGTPGTWKGFGAIEA